MFTKKLFFNPFIYLWVISISVCQSQNNAGFQFGADQLLSDYFHLIKNKKLGIITNHTAILSNGVHLVDTLHSRKDVKIIALFGPEHGIRGNNPAGEKILHQMDTVTGLPVYSLYGKDKKPSKEMLKDIDLLVFDIQDVGARFYTYISTLFYSIQAAGENNIPIVVLDRPNPINGIYIDGPVRKDNLASFIGIAPIPIVHGMTVAELAKYFIGEKLIGESLNVNLQIIKMKNWNRQLYYDYFHKDWINPSPNIPTLETAIVYPGTCLIEGTNVSEGRGTKSPFLTVGAPFINSNELIKELTNQKIEGAILMPTAFTPIEIPGIASSPKYKNENCFGINIKIENRDKFESVKFGLKLIKSLHKLYPNEFKFMDDSFDRLCGDTIIRKSILAGRSSDEIISLYQEEVKQFNEIRIKYLLY